MDDRYSRQILFAPIGAGGQQRLAAARVTVVGCGALGTAQADLLARAGVGRLHLVDRDFVEASNLQRQTLFDEEDARAALPKAVAARARLGRVNSAIRIEALVADLIPANAEELLAGSDVVLDGTDNFETRYLLNDWAVARGVPWVYGAAVASRGMSFTVIPGETACLNCLFPEYGREGAAVHETCDTVGVLAWTVSQVAAVQVAEAVKLLVGARSSLRRSLWSADLWRNEFRELAAPARDPQCRACGHREFVHLEGEARAAVTLCGRNAVQIHEHRRQLELAALAVRLRPHGEVRANDFALRFLPLAALGASDAPGKIEMMIFPDGRALIKGVADAGLARSLYARYVGA